MPRDRPSYQPLSRPRLCGASTPPRALMGDSARLRARDGLRGAAARWPSASSAYADAPVEDGRDVRPLPARPRHPATAPMASPCRAGRRRRRGAWPLSRRRAGICSARRLPLTALNAISCRSRGQDSPVRSAVDARAVDISSGLRVRRREPGHAPWPRRSARGSVRDGDPLLIDCDPATTTRWRCWRRATTRSTPRHHDGGRRCPLTSPLNARRAAPFGDDADRRRRSRPAGSVTAPDITADGPRRLRADGGEAPLTRVPRSSRPRRGGVRAGHAPPHRPHQRRAAAHRPPDLRERIMRSGRLDARASPGGQQHLRDPEAAAIVFESGLR
jgi:hypothetical protein